MSKVLIFSNNWSKLKSEFFTTIRRRKKIRKALATIHTPFTSSDMAQLTGINTQRVQGLLRGMDGVEKYSVDRSSGVRAKYRVTGSYYDFI